MKEFEAGTCLLGATAWICDFPLYLGVLEIINCIHSIEFSLQIFISINSSTNSTLSNFLGIFKISTKMALRLFYKYSYC